LKPRRNSQSNYVARPSRSRYRHAPAPKTRTTEITHENIRYRSSPGDGTGPEVTAEALKVAEAAARKFNFKLNWHHYDFGGDRYLRTGEVLPDSAADEFRKFKAMYLGAIGHPQVKPGILEKGILLRLRFELEQYINLRPVKLYRVQDCPLKDKRPKTLTSSSSAKTTRAFTPARAGSSSRTPPMKSPCRNPSTPAGGWIGA
jgi:hypothetical protein